MKDKKGAELSMNVIVIAIIVILVLIIVVAFFTGGFAELYGKMKTVFRGSVPDDLSLAVSSCDTNCRLAQNLGSDIQKANSPYCTSTWRYDSDNDGKSDELHHCWSDWIRQDCPGITDLCGFSAVEPM